MVLVLVVLQNMFTQPVNSKCYYQVDNCKKVVQTIAVNYTYTAL